MPRTFPGKFPHKFSPSGLFAPRGHFIRGQFPDPCRTCPTPDKLPPQYPLRTFSLYNMNCFSKPILIIHIRTIAFIAFIHHEGRHTIKVEIHKKHTMKHKKIYTVFQKKTPTHIIGYKLRSSCLILIIFDIKIPHII